MKKRNYYTFDAPVLVLMNDNFISVNRMLVDVTDNHPHLIRFFAESEGVYESDLVCAAHYHNTFEVTKPNHNESVISQVRPKDRVRIETKLTGKKACFYFIHGELYVGDKLCVKGDFSFAVVDANKV